MTGEPIADTAAASSPPPAATGPRLGGPRTDRRRYLYPGLWLAYLLQPATAIHDNQPGRLAIAGYAIIVAFAVAYLAAVAHQWGALGSRARAAYWVMWALWLATIPLARQDAYVLCIFLAVLTVARWTQRALPAVAVLTVMSTFVPALVPGWHAGVQWDALITIPLVALSMWAFFGIIRSNAELSAARAEVARLAAENERSRIARDLHDLLGHSLTTITVKAGLARRLSERGQSRRALTEIGEVERLSRRTLADVRAAVSGQREIRLANELATAREVLRAAGIDAELPGSVDIVDPTLSELFGWVVREGVTNVVRHSRATRCTIALGPGFIEITDDGRGSATGPAAGSGVAGLRERITAAGGTLHSGGTDLGWRLRAEVPVAAAPPAPRPVPVRTIEA